MAEAENEAPEKRETPAPAKGWQAQLKKVPPYVWLGIAGAGGLLIYFLATRKSDVGQFGGLPYMDIPAGGGGNYQPTPGGGGGSDNSKKDTGSDNSNKGGGSDNTNSNKHSYIVQGGDNLTAIAARLHLANWQVLWNSNQSEIIAQAHAHGHYGNEYNWIFPGEVLTY